MKQHPTLALCCVSIMQCCATWAHVLVPVSPPVRACLRASSLGMCVGVCIMLGCYSAISHRAGVIQLDLECERFFAYKDSESGTKELLQRISQSLFSSQAHYHWRKNHLQKINCRLALPSTKCWSYFCHARPNNHIFALNVYLFSLSVCAFFSTEHTC